MSEFVDFTPTEKIYDFEEAVGFASAWTGIDLKIVDQVMTAKEQYLRLAGIIQDEEDEALFREREAVRHLLPETPDFIDDRESQYVALVTGIDEATILLVNQGESAYMESLGLIDWDNEDERNESLGSPELAEEACDAEEAEELMHEGHGDHWEGVVPEVGTYIQEHVAGGPNLNHLRFQVTSPFPRWDCVTASAIPQTPTLETLRLDGDRQGDQEIITAFPVVRGTG